MRIMRKLTILAVLSLTVLSACGEKPEVRQARAQTALKSGKPDDALKLIDKVLEAQPNNEVALLVKAQAQMSLAQFAAAKATLDKLLAINPNFDEARRVRIELLRRVMDSLLQTSGFANDAAAQKRFDDELGDALTQVKWREEHKDAKAEGAYMRATFCVLEIRKLDVFKRDMDRSLADTPTLPDDKHQEAADKARRIKAEREKAKC